jgi:glycosyltransferase involved in cell wall biosynthesis
MRFAFLSSTPPSPLEGSGTFVGLDGLLRGLEDLGHEVSFRPLRFRTQFHTLDRWLYNAGVVLHAPLADVVVGVDLDGFLWAGRRGARASGRGRTPFIVMPKGVIADELRNERGVVRLLLSIQARWERINCARADLVVVPSQYSAGVVHELYDVSEARIAVVPEPIDLKAWRRLFAGAPPRARTRPTVLAVARMYPRKRLGDLLEAAARLRTRIPTVEVRIVGEGPERARLRARHARLGLDGTVVFLGEISRRALAVEYACADCFCLPSVQEGFGLVFAEAMAAGLPIVACRTAAIPEVVVNGQTGVLVNPGNPEELAMALESLLLDESRRAALGAGGQRRVEAFDLPSVAARFVEALPA